MISTRLTPIELLERLKSIELEVGRIPRERHGPREIDLDVLLYDSLTLQSDLLTIPHPGLHERPFVLVPLNELFTILY